MENTYCVLLLILILSIFLGGCTTTSQTNIAPSQTAVGIPVDLLPPSQTKCILPQISENSNTITQTYPYVVNGQEGSIVLTLNKHWSDYFACRSDEFGSQHQIFAKTCNPSGDCTNSIYFDSRMELINETKKYSALNPLIDAIKSKSTDPEMQARIAISLVQHIPYDNRDERDYISTNGAKMIHSYSPYEVLYENKGNCVEKEVLLAGILNDLEFESALFQFSEDKHEMVGIGGSGNDQYQNTGYIIIETTIPYPIGEIPDNVHTTYSTILKIPGTLKFHLTSQDRI